MQVILTEDEYLKLKNQHEEQKKTYVKRIDVALSLQELFKEFVGAVRPSYDPVTFQRVIPDWQTSVDKFWERIDGK